MRYGIAALAFFLVAASAHAQTAIPFTFTAGAPARASEVNGNFQALLAAINNVDARVARLEGGALSNAAIAGNYRILGFQTGVMASGPGLVETITYDGTLAVAADGTYTGSLNEHAHDLALSGNTGSTLQTRTTAGEALSGTYAISQGTRLTLNNFGGANAIEFQGAAGARILAATFQGEDPPPGGTTPMGTNTLLLLVRTN